MTLYERVEVLAKKQGLSVFDLSDRLNLSRNAIYSWKKSSPKAETLAKVAEYFDVTTDYLLGLTDDPSSNKKSDNNLSPDGRAVGRDFDNLGPSKKALLKKMIAAMQEDDDDDD